MFDHYLLLLFSGMAYGSKMLPQPLRRNKQGISKNPLKSPISEGFWSE